MRWPVAAALSGLLLLQPLPAEAYIDPGTGSYLVQALVAAALGSALAMKTYWHRIKGFFSRSAAPSVAEAAHSDPARSSSSSASLGSANPDAAHPPAANTDGK